MNERTQASNNGASRSTRAPGGLATSARPATNLFRNQLSRRPTVSASNSTESMRLEADLPPDPSSEIVVRDQHGEIEMGNPPTPVVDDEEELLALENRQENEKERQRLTEAVKLHRISHSSLPDQPDVLFDAVRESLRAKVTALAEDNWMFEPEEQTRG